MPSPAAPAATSTSSTAITVVSTASSRRSGADLGNWVKDRIPEDTGGMFLLTYGDLMERLSLLSWKRCATIR